MGASNIDYAIVAHQTLRLGESNPAMVHMHAGGVGRNVAENLGRLGLPLTLITNLAPSPWDEVITSSLPECVRIEGFALASSSSYFDILNDTRDLHLGLAAMDVLETLEVSHMEPLNDVLKEATHIILDLNFPQAIIDEVFSLAKGLIFVEGTSAAKVTKIKAHLNRIHTLKMNHSEATALSGQKTVIEQAKWLMDAGVNELYLTMAEQGVYHQSNHQDLTHHHAPEVSTIVSTTGAGDAFFAGLVYATINHRPPLEMAFTLVKRCLSVPTPVDQSLRLEDI